MLVTITSQPDRPKWLRAPAPVGTNYRELKDLVTRLKLHTVCESAACPNVGECWNRRTATFMILGNVCTRRCGFCAVQKGAPLAVDYCRVEVLVPDFQGSREAMSMVMNAHPDVLNHNTETVPRLYGQVRLGAQYKRSLDMLRFAKQVRPHIPTKSGLMLGLGETNDEVLQVMRDLHDHHVDILTLGQYLRPSAKHLPVLRYVSQAEFNEFRNAGLAMGFAHVEAGPLVRSSYHADSSQESAAAAHSDSPQ